MTTMGRTIHVNRNQRHLAWDKSIQPVVRIESGDVVEFDMPESSGGQVGPDSTVQTIRDLDFTQVDPVNGPVYVEGAKPGDTLQIDILDLQPADWGWTAIVPGFGLLADEFPDPAIKVWHFEDGSAEFAPGIRIPLEPFCGETGVAPGEEGALSTIPPYSTGGNMDTKHLTKGATLYLPVQTDGALFSMGDGHAAQGDGEVCGVAIETPMRATVRLTVRTDHPVEQPQFLTAGPLNRRTNTAPYYATDGVDPDLMEAARKAVRSMIKYLQRTYDLSRDDAYMLCSVAADLKICEIVDAPHWLVGAFLPQSIFQQR
ncbi:MAG TPA: acetamidase/formamidase family protein [Chloroflexota bacterium]|nr:acetamidase/formamidase family protein [Chloroflexota bacterium]